MDDPNQTRSHSPLPLAETCDWSPVQLGRYRILGRVGAGGMGTVYRAEDPQLGRVIAVKVPHLDRRNRAAAVARFLREARTAAQVRHPNVCPIHDLGEHDGTPYIVMPFCDGPSLAQVVRPGRLSDDRDAARLAALIADGLAAIHAQGIVHRDLKPGNILLSAERGMSTLTPQITDFGLARPDDDAEHLTHEGAVMGTPAYMSPEQGAGDNTAVGPQSDLYALGVILYQMLTGRLPFDGPAGRVLADIQSRNPEPPSVHRPDLDPRLAAIVSKAMARQSAERYASAQELGDDLRRWLADAGQALSGIVLPGLAQADFATPAPAGPTTRLATAGPRATSSRAKWVAAAVLATVFAGMAVGAARWLVPPGGEGFGPSGDGNGTAGRATPNPTEPPAIDTEAQKDADARAYLVRALQICDTIRAEPPETIPNPSGGRVRRLRVNITFEHEFNGASNLKQLPFMFLVLADLSGPPAASEPLAKRKVLHIDRDDFDAVMKRAAPRLTLRVPRREGVPGNGPDLEVTLAFGSMNDFRPAGVARQIPALQALLNKEASAALSAQLADVLMHPDFRKLEGTWRGLHYLVHHTETSQMIQIWVLNATKAELASDQAGAFDQTALYQRIYADKLFDSFNRYPYSLIIGDYEFGPDEADLRLVQALGALAERAQAPFVAAAGPPFFGVERFTTLPAGKDLAALAKGDRLRGWREFRALPAARFVALTLPRVLARSPYGQWKGELVKEFRYVEPMPRDDRRDNLVWMSAAWPLAVQVAEKVAIYNWPARLCATRGGDVLPSVPRGQFHNPAGPSDFGRSTDCTLTARQERELTDLGFMPLIDLPDRGPLFVDARPAFQSDPAVPNPDGRLDLPAMLCGTRLTQTATVLIASVGTFDRLNPADGQAWLRQWAANYVLRDEPALAAAEMRWKKPLSEAAVVVREMSGRPGSFELELQVRPHLHFDAPAPRLRLVARIPKPG